MNKQKLISVLQSRIAKRRMHLASYWELFEELVAEDSGDSEAFKMHLLRLGDEQKEDKLVLKQLVEDEREIDNRKQFQHDCDVRILYLEKIVRELRDSLMQTIKED